MDADSLRIRPSSRQGRDLQAGHPCPGTPAPRLRPSWPMGHPPTRTPGEGRPRREAEPWFPGVNRFSHDASGTLQTSLLAPQPLRTPPRAPSHRRLQRAAEPAHRGPAPQGRAVLPSPRPSVGPDAPNTQARWSSPTASPNRAETWAGSPHAQDRTPAPWGRAGRHGATRVCAAPYPSCRLPRPSPHHCVAIRGALAAQVDRWGRVNDRSTGRRYPQV